MRQRSGAPPISQSGSGDIDFFSQDLGTVLRLRYNTENYGQDGTGNFDIGTMQVVTMEDTAAFVDGQVTMNEVEGVGFNIGLGYRWMSDPPYSPAGRMEGVSLWVDGTHTDAGNFFPQIGVSVESLGETWDVRANGYIPVGQREQVGPFEATNQIGFTGNSLADLTQATVDRSFYAGELEFARRMGPEREAWAFGGPYFVANDTDDSAGFRLGARGYAYPDLLLQFAVSHDEVFNTNATFSIAWFVGRTRTNFQPDCGPAGRMREPVARNDYVVLSHHKREGGTALTQPDGSALPFVHVDSNAAPGGDGTFEHPYDLLSDINGTGSPQGAIILVHSTSELTGDQTTVLKNNQRLLGEGNNVEFMVDTKEKGTIVIPESSPGARALARPMILQAIGDAVQLADANEVANFDIDGQNITARAIAAPATGAGDPNLHDLTIKNTTSDGIFFKPEDFIDTNDVNGNGNTTERLVRGNVTIDNVTFDNVGGNDIDINSATAVDVTLPTVTLEETLALSNITSTNGIGPGINIENTHTGVGNATLTGYTYDGGTTSAGAIRLNNYDGSFVASNSTLTNGATTGNGVQVLGDTEGSVTFDSTVAFNNLGGTAFDVNGDDAGTDKLNGTITVQGDITNDTGRSVSVQNIASGATVEFDGKITDTGDGILANSNSGGSIFFVGDLDMTIDTPAATAVALTNNTGATIDFASDVVIQSTSSANGFVATGGGTLSAPGTVNSVSTATGQGVVITDMTIDPIGANFGDVNRTASAATSAIQFENNTGGPITVGNTTDTAGDAGTIVGGTADAIRITNSANVSVTGLRINNTSAVSGVRVEKSNSVASTVNLSDLEINGGDIGVETVGGGTGAVTMTVNDTATNSSTAQGMSFNNLDVGTVQVNNATIDGNNVNGTAGGVLITGSDASINFDSATRIREFGGTDFEVNGGAGAITFAGGIVNSTTVNAADTAGRSVVVHGLTGGNVTFTAASSINDDNDGMLVHDNGTASINFLGTNTFNTTTDAVKVTNNDVGGTNANITFAGLNITTTGTGRGFVAELGGTLSVTGTTNQIHSENGTGLSITDMTIGAVDFNKVTVDGGTGPANAIVMQNLIGGLVAIGPAAGGVGAGGQLRSTDDAIVIQNVQSALVQQVRILSAGDAAGDNGVEISHTAAATTAMDITIDGLKVDTAFDAAINVAGANSNEFNLRLTNGDLANNVAIALTGSGHFGLLVDNTDITTSGTDVAFALTQSGSAQNADVTFRNGNNFTTGDANALFIDSAGASGKTFNLLVEDSTFTNNSAGSASADITARQTSLMNATIQGNTFTNANAAGLNYNMTSNGAAAFMRLNLGGDGTDRNTAAAGLGEYHLHELAGSDFDVFLKDDTFNDLRNTGHVVPDPNAAAFDDLPTAPPLPAVP